MNKIWLIPGIVVATLGVLALNTPFTLLGLFFLIYGKLDAFEKNAQKVQPKPQTQANDPTFG